MLGTLRFALALLVVLNHTWLPVANKVGAHAVTAFYVISGYLMTKIIHEVYGLTLAGAGRYLGNRFLRIFVPYWAFSAIAVVVLIGWPDATFSRMGLPHTVSEAFRHITLINVTYLPTAPIPPSWSLSVECFFYIAMVAALARHHLVAAVWLAASFAATVYLNATGANYGERYLPLHAASLFFAIGSVIYFQLPRLRAIIPSERATIVLIALFGVWPLLVEWAGGDRTTLGYYGATAIFIPALLGFLGLARPRWQAIDAKLGSLSYPIYITHCIAAGIVKASIAVVTPMSAEFTTVTIVVTLLISLVSVSILDGTVERLRDRIRRHPDVKRKQGLTLFPRRRPMTIQGQSGQILVSLSKRDGPLL